MSDRKAIRKRLTRARLQFYPRAPESLAEAAKYFNLDPNNVRQREELLYKLVDVVFGPDGKKGRPKGTRTSWGDRLRLLGQLYGEKKRENPKLSDAKIARLINSEREDFKNDDPEQIRQRLTAIELLAPTCAMTEQTMVIKGTTCLNPDAVIGHNLGPPLDSPSIIPDGSNNLAPRWSTPQIEEIPWDDHWHLVYLRLSKTGEGVVSDKAA